MRLLTLLRREARNVLKMTARRLGHEIVRGDRMPQCTFNLLELAYAAVYGRQQAPDPFLQIGANDGILRDPLRPLILRYKLRGVLVEPIPSVFEKLKQNYAGQSNLTFENAAIMERDGTAMLYVPEEGAGGLGTQVASFDRKHLLLCGIPSSQVREEKVSALSVTSLLRKHQMRRLSILQIDTEGLDFMLLNEVLKTGMEADIVHFENSNLSREEKAKSRLLLKEQQYEFMETFSDTLAIRSDKLTK